MEITRCIVSKSVDGGRDSELSRRDVPRATCGRATYAGELIFIWLVALIMSAGCDSATRMAASLRELQVVQTEVAKFVKAEVDSVGVRLINRFLIVTLINSPLRDARETEKKVKAKEIARVAYQSYQRRGDLRMVDVEFVTSRTYLGVLNTSSVETLTFPVDELKQEGSPTGRR